MDTCFHWEWNQLKFILLLTSPLSQFQVLTWIVHAPLQHSEGISRKHVSFISQSLSAIQGEMPQTRLPLAVSRHLLRGLFKTVAETQIMADCVFPPIWSCKEKGEVLSRKTERKRNNEKQIFYNLEFVWVRETMSEAIIKFFFLWASLVHEEPLTPIESFHSTKGSLLWKMLNEP